MIFKLFPNVLILSLLIAAILHTAATGQVRSAPVSVETSVWWRGRVTFPGWTDSRSALVPEPDSLRPERKFFATTVKQQENPLPPRSVVRLLGAVPEARTLYRQGQVLKPAGPLLAASGLVVGYIAVKGTPKTAFARGVGTPANPSVPDVPVEYTSRSLPKLVAGISLLVGGLCLIEFSNELTGKSIKLYNAKIKPHRLASGLQRAELGITASGNVGLKADFCLILK